MTAKKDDIFRHGSVPGGFRFDQRVAEVFDDMLSRSVPFYPQVIEMIAAILARTLRPGDTVYDLGCSTAATLVALARRLADMDIHFIGVDNSAAMLDKARLKVAAYIRGENIRFVEQDITKLEMADGCGAIIINYTMQFLTPEIRMDVLKKAYALLRPGGMLILSEKVIMNDVGLNGKFVELYHDFKRYQGYSELEIAKKREALEDVLVPLSIAENKKNLNEAGFGIVETFFQWFNFVSLLAVKEE